jgi:hypothetical protein
VNYFFRFSKQQKRTHWRHNTTLRQRRHIWQCLHLMRPLPLNTACCLIVCPISSSARNGGHEHLQHRVAKVDATAPPNRTTAPYSQHNKIYLNYAVCYLYTLTSQICRNTPIQCHIPEDQNRQLYSCGNIKIHLDIEHPRWCIKSQRYVYLTVQSHTTSYITHVILATSFGSENEPSSGH